MSSSTSTTWSPKITSIVFDYTNATGLQNLFLKAYCLSPPEGDGCQYGPCPNPDVTGTGQQISVYFSAGAFTLALVYLPQLVRPMLYAHLAVIYSLMIAALISMVHGELTLNDSIFVLVAVGSPCTIYLWFTSLWSLVNSHRFKFPIKQERNRRGHREVYLLKLLCLLSMLFEIVLIFLLFTPSSPIHLSQPSCNREFGKEIVIRMAWGLQYAREGAFFFIVVATNAWFFDRRINRTTTEQVSKETSVNLDIIGWTEALLQSRYPSIMSPHAAKCVVAAFQVSGFATLFDDSLFHGIVVTLILLWGVWHPYILKRLRDESFLPTKTLIIRILFTLGICGLSVPPAFIRAAIVGGSLIIGLWLPEVKRLCARTQPPAEYPGRSIYVRNILASCLVVCLVLLFTFVRSFTPTTSNMMALFIIGTTCFPHLWRDSENNQPIPSGSTARWHPAYIVFLLDSGLALFIPFSRSVMAGRIDNPRILLERPLATFVPFISLTLEAGDTSLWVVSWLGTATLLQTAGWRWRLSQIWRAMSYRAHIFKFGLLVVSPNALWMRACVLSNPTKSNAMTFGQIFTFIVSFVTLVSLVDELRKFERAKWVAFIKSEPLPGSSSIAADPDPILPTTSVTNTQGVQWGIQQSSLTERRTTW